MAVIKELPGLQATIAVNGQVLQEYDDPSIEIPDDDDVELLVSATKETKPVSIDVKKIPQVVKYIEVIQGANFTMQFTKGAHFNGRCNHIGVVFERDGNTTDVCHEPRESRRKRWQYNASSIRCGSAISGWFYREFQFGDFTAVEDCDADKIHRDKANSKNMGVLRVLVYKMKMSEVCEPVPYFPDPVAVDNVAEKALKGRALTSTTHYGPREKTSPPPPRFENIHQDPLKRPCAIFEFRYQTREGLIQEGIIPRPTPIDNMNDQEVREYALRLHRQHEDSIKSEFKSEDIKREDGDRDFRGQKRPGTNSDIPSAKRYKETRREDGKTLVDLSD